MPSNKKRKRDVGTSSNKSQQHHHKQKSLKKKLPRREEELVIGKKAALKAEALTKKTDRNAQSSSTNNNDDTVKDVKPRPCREAAGLDQDKFLCEGDAMFETCLKTSYCGFEKAAVKDEQLKKQVADALEALRKEGFFHYDIVQYNDKVNATSVQRVLIGEPGMTYLYQKLRLFALPWNDNSIMNGALGPIKKLNKQLIRDSSKLIEKKKKQGGHVGLSAGVGRCDFNVTLINFCRSKDANGQPDINLPDQPRFPMKHDSRFSSNQDKLAVGWHKDSTLEDFSTIAVYQHNPVAPSSHDWRIGMCCDVSGMAPPLAVSLKDGDSYFMLGNFNHHHLHAVMAGRSARYASTHRVAVTHKATYDYIQNRAREVLEQPFWQSKNNQDTTVPSDQVRLVGELLVELEFEWIRQFYIQGKIHMNQHSTFWKPRIEKLLKVWKMLWKELKRMVNQLSKAKREQKAHRMMLFILETIQTNLETFNKRITHNLYKKLPSDYQPIDKPEQSKFYSSFLPAWIKALQQNVS